MSEQVEFEMTQADLDRIKGKLQEARAVPLIALNVFSPPDIQKVANDAWAELGERLGFDPMSVLRSARSERHFYAVRVPTVEAVEEGDTPELDPSPAEALAEALYNLSPCGDQETDADGRPTGPGYEITWRQLDSYDPRIADAVRSTAKRIAELGPLALDTALSAKDFTNDATRRRLHDFADLLEADGSAHANVLMSLFMVYDMDIEKLATDIRFVLGERP